MLQLQREIKTSLPMVSLQLSMQEPLLKAAFLNVRINISGIKDESNVAQLKEQMDRIESELDEKEAAILALYK